MLTYGEMRSPTEVPADRETLARVQKGIAMLKREYGDDWVEKIDLERLNLTNSSRCVLGQITGDWSNESERLWGSDWMHQSAVHGFSSNGVFDPDDREAAWASLQRVWEQEIGLLKAE